LPTPTDARALQSVIGDLATLAIRDVVKLVGDYGSDPSFEWLLERVLPELLAPYIDGSAMVTAKHYTDMAPDLPYAGQEFPGISSERIAGTVKWALFGQRGSMLKRLAGPVHRIDGAALGTVLVKPLDDLQVTVSRGHVYNPVKPMLRDILVKPLNHVQVPIPCGKPNRLERATFGTILVQPLHDRQMTIFRGLIHCAPTPFLQSASVLVQPLDHFQVPIFRGQISRALRILHCSILVQPPDQLIVVLRGPTNRAVSATLGWVLV
jgi:hypothetical protein